MAGEASQNRESSPACGMERETGFEPATLSLGTVFTESPTTCKDVQPFAIPADPVSDAVQRSRENPLLFEDFATPVLRRKLTVGTTPERFLTVREAARRLKVSTATVYKACARGEMPCVRVVNVLRIPEGGLGGRGMVRGPGVSTREGSP